MVGIISLIVLLWIALSILTALGLGRLTGRLGGEEEIAETAPAGKRAA